MVLKRGYKQSEVGVIPEDWEAKEITSISKIFGGGTPSTVVKEFWHGEIPWVAAGDVSSAKGRFICDTADRITELGLNSCSARIMPVGTTIIIARGATVGRIAQLGEEMAFNQTCYGLLPISGFDKDFLYYSMKYSVSSILKGLTFGTIFGTITTQSFAQWKIPLPQKLSEQRAIAAALSDVDALLAALDALIAKKRLIQQGAMQELLTGRRRLPGFSGEWETRKIKDVAIVFKGRGLSKDQLRATGQECILYGELFTTYGRIIEKVVSFTDSKQGVPSKSGDILMPGSTTTLGIDLAVASALLVDNVQIGGDVNIIRAKKTDCFSSEFLAYYLTYVMKNSIVEAAQGVTIYHLYGRDILELELRLPSYEEQCVISKILVDIDDEIQLLEHLKKKTALIKQGMMQELLTGKTRLNWD